MTQPFTDFPYTILGKVKHFPWRYYSKWGGRIKHVGYTAIALFPMIVAIHLRVNTQSNKALYAEIRSHRAHTPHDPLELKDIGM